MTTHDNALSIPDGILAQLDAADKRKGFPPGTMQSLMQQEIGGQFNKFLNDPAAHHFEANKEGKRIGPGGRPSSAFGPFGILESTAADPGYGTAPLKDKSFEAQIEFAADYLSNRSKKGGLAAGLANYGEGANYASQVLGRIGLDTASPTAKQSPVTSPIPIRKPSPGKQPVLPAIKPEQVPQPQSNNINAPQNTPLAGLSVSPVAGIQAPDFATTLAQIGSGGSQVASPQPLQPIQRIAPQENRAAVANRLRQIQDIEVKI